MYRKVIGVNFFLFLFFLLQYLHICLLTSRNFATVARWRNGLSPFYSSHSVIFLFLFQEVSFQSSPKTTICQQRREWGKRKRVPNPVIQTHIFAQSRNPMDIFGIPGDLLLGILGGGVPRASPNPDSDQKTVIFHTRFQTRPSKIHTHFQILPLGRNRAFSFTWPASMLIYWNKRKHLHEKRVKLPGDFLGTSTWPPFHCFGTTIWPPWRHVKKLYCVIIA